MRSTLSALRPLVSVYVVLLVLLALTASATLLPPGPWKAPVGMAIAGAKAVLIFTYFMRLRNQSWLVRTFALAGFLWLAIAVTLVLADYLTRPGG